MAWRASTVVVDLPMQFPWILESLNDWRPQRIGELKFYSVPFSKVYTIKKPRFVGVSLHGSSNGYLIFKRPFSLLNPLNNHWILLPTTQEFVGSCRIGPWKNQIGIHAVCRTNVNIKDAVLFSCHLGQHKWQKIDLGLNYQYCNPFCLDSMLFSVERNTGVTKVVDIESGTLAYVIPPPQCYLAGRDQEYILKASGDILGVFRHRIYFSSRYIDVHRLAKSGSGSMYWVKVDDIGNQALFLDEYSCFALKADDVVGIRRNCIYSLPRMNRVDRIDIKTGAKEYIPCPFKRPERWFCPSFHRLRAE